MAPVDNSSSVNMHGYKLECSLKANDTIPVHKYKSINTGITVFIAEVESPVTCEFLCLATEAFDDDGLPHTLEHLIFLGSEEYPYKGLLDLWANRCVASGTNAQTDTKYTQYTMSTASTEGFLSTTQMYLDHILYPTLTESAFITEIYHVNGEGEDGGVVYCEMQGRESQIEYFSYFELRRAIYPGKCGYKSITGGALKDIRESVNNEKIKKYHKEFYRPENLTIIIAGKIKHTDVFKALQPMEEKIISKGDRGPYNRPWQNPVPPFTKSITLDLLYASDDEKHGLVTVGWRGPSAVSEIYDLIGCSLLLKYLTDTAVSPLQKEFVEINDPYSSRVVSCVVNNSSSLLYVKFEGVPKAKITLIKDIFLRVLNNINESEHGLDMKRMKTIVHKSLLEVLSDLEKNPHDTIADLIVEDVLYGNTKEDLKRRLNPIQDLKKLEEEPEEYWSNLFKKYLIDGPVAIVQAIPSIEKKREIAQQEKERLKKRIESLGPQGLEEKEQQLQRAIQENNKPIPSEIWNKVPKLSIDSINFLHIKSYSTSSQGQHPRFNTTKLPFFTCLDHVDTNFIYLFVVMDTKLISKELRPYVPLLLEVIQESPVHRGDRLIPYEEVVAELEEDTISTNTRLGFNHAGRFSCGAFSNSVQLLLQLELGKYAKGVQWIHELLYETEFSPERLKIVASKIINDIAEVKRAEPKIIRNLIKGTIYNKDTNYFASNIVQQEKFLTKMIERLDNKAEKKEVIAEIESVRKMLTAYNNMMLFVTTNIDKLTAQVPDVYEPWNTFFPKMETTNKMKLNIQSDWALRNPVEENPIKSCVLGLGYTQSGFLSQYCPCIKDFQSPDLASLLVCIQYLIQIEGPMWKTLRGQGYAYSYNIFPDVNEGLLYFTLFKSTNIVAAYREAQTIVESHISENNWDPLLFESAKSSLIYEIVEKERTVGDLVYQSWLCYFKNVSHDYNQQMVRRISEVTIQDMHRVGSLYLTPLFDSKASKTAIVCHSTKVSEVVNSFKEWNKELRTYNSLEETHLNDW